MSEDSQQSAVNQVNAYLMGNQSYQQLLKAKAPPQAINAAAWSILQSKGIDPSGLTFTTDPTSAYYGYPKDPTGGFDWKLAAGILLGGAGAAFLLPDVGAAAAGAGAGAGTAGVAGGSGSLLANAGGAFVPGGAATAGASAATGTAAATGGLASAAGSATPFWQKLIAPGLGIAASLGASAIQAGAAGKASQQQVAAQQQGLSLLGGLYQQGTANLAPYQQAGGAGLSALQRFLHVGGGG